MATEVFLKFMVPVYVYVTVDDEDGDTEIGINKIVVNDEADLNGLALDHVGDKDASELTPQEQRQWFDAAQEVISSVSWPAWEFGW